MNGSDALEQTQQEFRDSRGQCEQQCIKIKKETEDGGVGELAFLPLGKEVIRIQRRQEQMRSDRMTPPFYQEFDGKIVNNTLKYHPLFLSNS